MKIVYRLVTYSRETERTIGSHDVPEPVVAKVKDIAGIIPDDDGCGDYPLDSRQTHEIGRLLGVPVTPDTADYFVEPYVYETGVGDRAAGK
jgi:hypothetical protein